MSEGTTAILLLGATGYIGGSVLERLLAHASASTFEITVLVRSADKAKLLETKFGVKVVVGSTGDAELLERLAEGAHVVFSIVSADDLAAMQAILRGMRKRHATIGDLPTLIHTSGTGVISSDDRGEFATETVYDDLNVDQIESLPPTAFHRNVDLAILEADQQGYLKSYIIAPGLIYGVASGALIATGIQNSLSIQMPALIGAALARGETGVIGKGLAVWPAVSINEISDLFIVLYDAIVNDREGDKVGHGREGFYFGENGEFTWLQLSKAIGEALHSLRMLKTKDITPFSKEDMVKYFGSEEVANYFGTNARCKANRSRAIGWKPTHTTADMIASVKPTIAAIFAQPDFFEKFKGKFAQ